MCKFALLSHSLYRQDLNTSSKWLNLDLDTRASRLIRTRPSTSVPRKRFIAAYDIRSAEDLPLQERPHEHAQFLLFTHRGTRGITC